MKYPLGIQTFEKIRNENYLYVDKTALIYELIMTGSTYFLSRPRRFGKSLLVSTFESLFRGKKALFEGLDIAETDYKFIAHPVIKFEFSNVQVSEANDLKNYIINNVNFYAAQFNITLTIDSYEQRFGELIREIHAKTGKTAVLLVDEYDKPILDNLFADELQAIKVVMGGFYAVAKQLDEHLKFVFITGVSKFAKLSVFSGMNSLTDISMEKEYAALCGVTQQELESNFAAPINELQAIEQLEPAALLAKIKHWYNGYKFHQQGVSVYNPYSLLSLVRKKEFGNYWFETATPTFLLDLLQSRQYDLNSLTEGEVGDGAFRVCEPENMGVQSIFLQTGYLTIKSFSDGLFKLDFPNFEVKKSFYDSVAVRYSHLEAGKEQTYIVKLIKLLKAQQFDDFFKTLEVFFANVPNNITIDNEKYYQSLVFTILKLIGLNIEVEVNTNIGRIDCVIETDDMICIIEFKFDGTKEQALQQIADKKYAQKYQLDNKKLVSIGVAFDKETRNISGYVIEAS